MDGICVTGSDNSDISEIRNMRQRVAESMAQEYGGQCREIYGRDGYADILGCTKKKCPDCLGSFYVINYPLNTFSNPLYFLTETPQTKTCESEADPCDPATGKVFLSETDIHNTGHGLSFTRHYQSDAMNQAKGRIGVNWRHNYASQLDARPDQDNLHRLPVKYSSFYANKEDACLLGGESIKASIYAGRVSNADINYTDNTCTVSINNQVVAKLNIEVADIQRPVSNVSLEHDIIRPNGQTYHFKYENDAWVNIESQPLQLTQDETDWILTLSDQSVEIYDSNGYLKHSSTPDGKTTNYQYQDGLLQTVTGPFGHTLNFTYTNGRITSVTGPDGAVNYSYDSNGNLIQVTYPDNTIRKYIYDDFYHISSLTGIIDENDIRTATWEYDPQGRVVMNERAGGTEHYEFTYNADGTTTVTNTLGTSRIYQFDIVNNALRFVQVTGDRCDTCGHRDDQQRSYDDLGHIISRTDWNGITTTYIRDARGLELSRTEAAGNLEARTITTEWHPDFRKPIRITEPDRITEFTYDSAGRLLNKTELALP